MGWLPPERGQRGSLVPVPSTEDGLTPELKSDFDDGDNGDSDDDQAAR